MNFGVYFQIIFNLLVFVGLVATWIRLSRPAKDDPRLSRGLQLLQTKISVLEDLSDRTETQVKQLTSLIEIKVKEIQNCVLEADKKIQQIESSRDKSMEVAKIFQDRIPHQEIIERQNTLKYIKAARLAHQGLSVDQICDQIDLSRGEIEFIAKVNKSQLQFSEAALPEWAKEEGTQNTNEESAPTTGQMFGNYAGAPNEPSRFEDSSLSVTLPQDSRMEMFNMSQNRNFQETEATALSDLGNKFRRAIQEQAAAPTQAVMPTLTAAAPPVPATPAAAPIEYGNNLRGQQIQVKKVVFPRVNINENLS